MRKIDLTGKRFGKLVAIKPSDRKYMDRSLMWECVCDCGQNPTVLGSSLRNGNTKSCGCYMREIWKKGTTTTHGMAGTRVYHAFYSMHRRCTVKKSKDWPLYGGRGIAVCERWNRPTGFVNFLADMGEPPAGTSLERIDNNGNYEPGNCKWATSEQQSNNRRITRFITWNGQTRTLTDWSKSLNRRAAWLWKRLSKYPLDKAMEPFNHPEIFTRKEKPMDHSEVTTMLDALRDELTESMERIQSDLQETIDNLRGDVDRLTRDLEDREERKRHG